VRSGAAIAYLTLSVGCNAFIITPAGVESFGPGGGSGGAGGSSGTGGGAMMPPGPCVPTGDVSATPMLRLTRAQVDNAVSDVLGAQFQPSSVLPTDEKMGPFAVNGLSLMTPDLADLYQFAAESIGDEVEANPAKFAPCANMTSGAHACADTFVKSLGQKLYRHPLDTDEHTRWLALYDTQAADAGYAGGVRAVVEGMLQSPNFLYRVEALPSGMDPASTDPWPLDGYALATRLSFLIWNSGPDDGLLAKAQSGALTPDALPAEVDRMLADERARHATGAFAEAWAGITALQDSASSPGRLGPLSPALVPEMDDDTTHFVDEVLRSGDGQLKTLFTATRTPAPPGVATEIYGAFFTQIGAEVQLPAGRSGILSNAAVLFTHAHSDQTSPTLRGRWVRENLLCQPIPDPPPTVVAIPAPPVPGQTTRQRYDAHRTDPSCSACHGMMDPVGYGFESFDQFGRHRDLDEGQPIDDTGTLIGSDVDGDFHGLAELGQKLASSASAQKCFARQWYRFGLGHDTGEHDACTLQSMGQSIAGGGGFAEALHTLVKSDAFTQRRSP
jgi:hypothetical protein